MTAVDSLDPHRDILDLIAVRKREAAHAETAFKAAAVGAVVHAGVPVAQVARAAGVTRETIYDWKRAAK